MSTSASTIKETDWVIGAPGNDIVHHTDSLKDCKEWIAGKHSLKRVPVAHRTDTAGVYEIHAGEHTYWAMTADVARDHGYNIPRPNTADTYGLEPGTCALYILDDGPALVWNNRDHIGQQPAPAGLPARDLDDWAPRCARRLRSLGIEYVGRREVRR